MIKEWSVSHLLNPDFSLSFFLWETVGFQSIFMVCESKRVFQVSGRERRTSYRGESWPPRNFYVFYFPPSLTPGRGISDLQPVLR